MVSYAARSDPSRLADFILAHLEPILTEWEQFARSVWPGRDPGAGALRDHAQMMLEAVALSMKAEQSRSDRLEKSKGREDAGERSKGVDAASDEHARHRFDSGFDMHALVTEYRALRASVIELWRDAVPSASSEQLDDLIRFNEAIDQLLARSVVTYAAHLHQSREVFLGILGHDLRNPLHSVKMLVHLLEKTGDLNARALKMTSSIGASADAMAKMLNDLLDFTGTRLGSRMEITREPMDLGALCQEVLEEMKGAYPLRTFEYTSEGDLHGQWDWSRLRQLIANLLGNAVNHGLEDTPVLLLADGEEAEVRLAVRNQGSPIPEDRQETIFEPLQRNVRADQRPPHGSIGLGLYIAREVVKAHGGAISVHSDESATCFTAVLPRTRAQAR